MNVFEHGAEVPITNWLGESKDSETCQKLLYSHLYRQVFQQLKKWNQRKGRPLSGDLSEEDIAVDVMVRMFEKAHQTSCFVDRYHLYGFLMNAMKWRFKDVMRKKVRRSKKAKFDTRFQGVDGLTVEEAQDFKNWQPTADDSLQLTLEFREKIKQLPNDLGPILELKLVGHSTKEIAEELNSSVPTINRKMKVVKRIWNELN